eukprot:290819-Prorocentrum_minimum.AAC.1
MFSENNLTEKEFHRNYRNRRNRMRLDHEEWAESDEKAVKLRKQVYGPSRPIHELFDRLN